MTNEDLFVKLAWWIGYGLAGLVVLALLNAVYRIICYGPRAYFRTAFRMDPENWRLVGILFLLAVAAAASLYSWWS